VTLDAMDWVWKHSQSRGNPRIALLAVADRVRTPACEVRVSYSDFMRALNVSSRTVVRDAIRAAEDLGELETVEAGKGTRKALYRLPKAVGYLRSGTESGPLEVKPPAASGPNPVPQAPVAPPASGTESGPQGTDLDRASGTDSDPVQSGIWTTSGTDSDPLYQPSSTRGGSNERTPAVGPRIPDFATELYRQLNNAGMAVTWQLSDTEWFKIHAHIKRCGIEFIVAFTRDRWNRNDPPQTARYLTRIWDQMPDPPQPAEPGLPALRAANGPTGPLTANQRKRSFFDDAAARFAGGQQ